MSEDSQPLVYHSLSRHVHSIPSEAEHLKTFNFYSSNQEPPMPSILERSRTKKSHEKSLKKGLSRVSKSKQTLTGQGTTRYENQGQLSKGTLLNFNIQEVVENKYQITKPRDEITEISPKKNESSSMKRIEASQPGSNQKSFISEYRIVTYVPSGRLIDDKRQSFARDDKESIRNQSGVIENWDKENNSNNSNVFRNNQNKHDTESIQIVNPMEENNLEQNTWRTSDNFDPYYSNNFGNELNQANDQQRQTQRQQLYSSLKPKYSVPVTNELNQLRSAVMESGPLKDKIKHLEHEIVQLERQMSTLVREKNNFQKETKALKEENQDLREENESLKEKTFSLRDDHESSIGQIRRLNEHILNLQEKIALLSQQKGNLHKEKSVSESYLFEETEKKPQLKSKSIQQGLRREIASLEEGNEVLSLAKAKLQKELSEKTLLITEITRKNKDLSEKISDIEKELRKEKEKIESQQEKLYKKDEKINSLSLEVDRLSLELNRLNSLNKQLKEKQTKVQVTQKSTIFEPNQFQSLAMDRSREEKAQNLLKEELNSVRHQYQQLQRDYAHLEKKHTFMKDELEHLKYLQLNASSSALSHRSTTPNHYNSHNPTNVQSMTLNAVQNNFKEKEFQQNIYELETRLQISERNFRQVEEEYSNLKQNFRALEELYIKQQDQNYELEQESQKLSQQNNKLKIQLMNLEQISKAKALALADNESLKLMEKEEELLRLKKDFSNLERKFNETQRKCIEMEKNQIQTQRKYSENQRRELETQNHLKILQNQLKSLKKQKNQFYDKYLIELQKNTILTERHREDVSIQIKKLEKEEKQKIKIVVEKYETLILKLQDEIKSYQNQIFAIKEEHSNQIRIVEENFVKEFKMNENKHLDELTLIENEHKEEVQTLLTQIDRQQLAHREEVQKLISEIHQQKDCQKCKETQRQRQHEQLLQSANELKRFESASKMNRFLNYESMSRKQLESFASELQSDFTLLENKYKTLIMQNQRLADGLESTSRHITHLEQEIRVYKQHKENSLKEKYELRQEVERTNLLMLEMKKTVSLFDDQKASFTSRINELNSKYLSTVQDYELIIQEVKEVKNMLYDKQMALQNCQHDIRELRINLLEEKELTEKKIREICVLKDEKDALKSKEEYYKMLFEKTQAQLEAELQQKAIFLATHAPKVPTVSPVKHQSPQKTSSLPRSKEVSPKTRENQLYRLQIYKDLNKLLNLTSEHFTFEQIIEKNEQEYLRMLFNAIKEDHSKIIELKELIVGMEESFKKEKVFIKQDYDVLYEKYLKYKSMCQDMNKDIERYKLKLKASKDHNFINIEV